MPKLPKIPDFPVDMYIREGSDTRFEVFFLDVKYDYDLVDFEYYKAWCLRKNKPIERNALHTVRLYNCYAPDLIPEFRDTDWNKINYIINHKSGSSKGAIQEAIWHFSGNERSKEKNPEAAQLIEEANLKGKDYRPAEGELLAIVVVPESGEQPVFIEYKIPEAVAAYEAPVLPPLAAAPPVPGGFTFPLIPIIPYIPTGSSPPSPPGPPPPPITPEPSSLLLLVSGAAGIMIYPMVRKRAHKKRR
jgi:hypothetical protein